jgi:hypothetical protein
MKKKYYYKVICKHGRKLLSSAIHPDNDFDINSDFCIRYKINKWTYPKVKGTKLFVFSSLKDAQNYIWHHNILPWDLKIYKCEIKGLKRNQPVIRFIDFDFLLERERGDTIKFLKSFFSKKKHTYHGCYITFEEGSDKHWCNAIKLIREVK